MRIFKSILFLFLSVSVLSSCKLENQNPKDVFYSGKLPKFLEKLANDHWQVKRHEKEIQGLIKKNAKHDKLIVAVIDNGVDLLHPELIKHINWKIDEQGRIAAGYDPVGGTRLANASFIDPGLFAFGAIDTTNGKIKGHVESPLDLLKTVQKEFSKLLEINLKKANLQDSFLSKISGENLSFLRAMDTVYKSQKPTAQQKAYEKRKDKLELFSPSMDPQRFREVYMKHMILVGVIYPQNINRLYEDNLGTKRFENFVVGDDIWHYKGAQSFLEALTKTISQLDAKFQVYEKVKQYQRFTATAKLSQREREIWEAKYKYEGMPSSLENALAFKMFGPKVSAKEGNLVKSIEKKLVGLKFLTDRSLQLPVRVSEKQIIDHLNNSINFTRAELLKRNENPSDLEERAEAELLRKSLYQLDHVMGVLKTQGELKAKKAFSKTEIERQRLMKYAKSFTEHPMYSSKSLEKSHGSHVSGLILKGNENFVSIEPVRPLTESMDISYEKSIELAREIEQEFKRFLSHPVISKGLKQKLNQHGFEMRGKDSRSFVINETFKLMRKHIVTQAKTNSLDFLFVEDIVSSIKHVGENKILLANVSLGTEFNKSADSDKEDRSKELYNFLAFEYFKFRVSEAIIAHAPYTTFFVAAGNSANWVDGHSKSALPFDLTSNYFKQFETKSSILPNHQQKNIIGVMSSNEYKVLSSFTNVAIHKNTPVIVATGENVLSMVRTTDESAIKEYVDSKKRLLDAPASFDLSDSEFKEMVIKFYGPTKGQRIIDLLPVNDYNQNSMYKMLVFDSAIGDTANYPVRFARARIMANNNLSRKRYNGTSMATPNALQAFSRWLKAKAEKDGLKFSELYGNENYTRDAFLKELSEWTTPLDKDTYLIPLDFVVGEKTYKPNADEKALRKSVAETLGLAKSEKSSLPSCKTSF